MNTKAKEVEKIFGELFDYARENDDVWLEQKLNELIIAIDEKKEEVEFNNRPLL